MMTFEFNKEGVPLLMSGSSFFSTTTGSPDLSIEQKKKILQVSDSKNDSNTILIDGHKIRPWGNSNNFPQHADKVISGVSVLNTGLKFLRNLTMGQGIFAAKVKGFDDEGNELIEPYPDDKVQKIVSSPMIRLYMENTLRDFLKYSIGFVQLLPDSTGNKIVGLNTLNAYYCRLTQRDLYGASKCCISGKWPETPSSTDYKLLDTLMSYDPAMDLDALRLKGLLKKSVVMTVRDSWSNQDTYGEPIWYPCFLAGWTEIAQKVPLFLKKVYQNQATLKWHIQIPYSFWDRKFPPNDYVNKVEERKKDIEQYMNDIERNMLGAENAEKPLFTNYSVNDINGRIEEGWIITPLDNKSKEGDKLVTSAAANSEILFSLMINPNVMGAGMPGGAYAGNQGGSNIREAFLVNIANAWVDRQNILDPVRVLLHSQDYEDVHLRFRNTILTTLNTGAGTQQNLA